ncbi:MAG TPA: 2-succinyl-5-enolpyruvyl-6-hydroxy-3-cyclohexene-1-carboxylic-acid synthase [Ignavibacteriales bacterium]|nr:2-succinyl-5-enolpyruvyl-6-hydroxy-3-cyclohexene-1-carboxylic-acid synthase [Ignavibacteriales bacterium]
MLIKINSSYFWANIFFDQLAECGVKYACISPGSRSTPLTYALSQNKKIKSYVIIDERTSGFFALGIAKQTSSPVVIVTTSGTAAAELYPAIIEAYQNRIPLIICTADRPAYLHNSGANQTINQNHLYHNHARYFYDTGLPKIELNKIKQLKDSAKKSFEICINQNPGPVQINFPFEKPLEPDSFTDEIEEKILLESLPDEISLPQKSKLNFTDNKNIQAILNFIKKNSAGLITIGPGNFSNSFISSLDKFSVKFSLPVFADASSGLRFKSSSIANLIANYDALIRTESFAKIFSPKFVLHFGRPLTSPKIENYFSTVKPKGFTINKFGDLFDPSHKNKIIKLDEEKVLEFLTQSYAGNNFPNQLNKIKLLDSEIDKLKLENFSITKKINEPGVLLNIINSIPPNSNLMIGNSVPVRDLDFFASIVNKNINVFQNRGASGIDGITSTALGICAQSKNPTYLVTGDLSFYYDLNSLLIAGQYNISLIIILINNNGGAIFKFLPIADHKNVFEKYFLTPSNLSFKKLTEAFGVDYKELKSQQDILNHIKVSTVRKKPAVFEIKTNSDYSLLLRKKFWKKSNKLVENFLRNYEA